ncbi:TetR/AcrR family transcriptional regulator [Actinomyces slackii]|nr:TetR family transcriptional regulator [Actinomyces slackii]
MVDATITEEIMETTALTQVVPDSGLPDSGTTPRGNDRRQAIIEAAAAQLRESGPSGVSHRSVAKRAGCSLSATTYYFKGLDDLLHHAGLHNISLWAARAERVADQVESLSGPLRIEQRVSHLLRATLPAQGPYMGHYLQLIAAGTSAPVEQAYREGRQRLNAAVSRVLEHLGSPVEPEMVIAVVDGAAVTALSEGRDVRATAAQYLTILISAANGLPVPQVVETRST